MWIFNLLLLWLHGEISLSLLCSHSSQGSALDLAPPLHVGRLRASVLRPDRRVLKEQPTGGSGLLRQGEGGDGSYNWNAGEPVAAEAGMTLQQPEVHLVFSWGSCPWITGPWQWQVAQLPGAGVWIVTCACTQASLWLQQQR